MFVNATGVVSVALVDIISTSCRLTCVLSLMFFCAMDAKATKTVLASNVLFLIKISKICGVGI